MILQLTKQSTDQDIKAYFEEVLRISRDSEEFPVNLDDVWPLVYAEKGKAVRALKTNELFIKDVDYILLAQNGKQVVVLSSSSPARFAPCSRSTAKCFIRWQSVN